MEASDSFVPTGWSSEELDIVDKIISDHMEAMNNSEFWPKTLPQLWAGFSKMWKDISAKLNEHGFQRSVQEVTHHFEKCVSISPQEPPAESDLSNANPNSMRSTVDNEKRMREVRINKNRSKFTVLIRTSADGSPDCRTGKGVPLPLPCHHRLG